MDNLIIWSNIPISLHLWPCAYSLVWLALNQFILTFHIGFWQCSVGKFSLSLSQPKVAQDEPYPFLLLPSSSFICSQGTEDLAFIMDHGYIGSLPLQGSITILYISNCMMLWHGNGSRVEGLQSSLSAPSFLKQLANDAATAELNK